MREDVANLKSSFNHHVSAVHAIRYVTANENLDDATLHGLKIVSSAVQESGNALSDLMHYCDALSEELGKATLRIDALEKRIDDLESSAAL